MGYNEVVNDEVDIEGDDVVIAEVNRRGRHFLGVYISNADDTATYAVEVADRDGTTWHEVKEYADTDGEVDERVEVIAARSRLRLKTGTGTADDTAEVYVAAAD